jgi:hypothetical protein
VTAAEIAQYTWDNYNSYSWLRTFLRLTQEKSLGKGVVYDLDFAIMVLVHEELEKEPK